ncbi:MAG: GAF domain-containing protein, partial [Planctomycetota bacterium]|nr:GAF domain-containing protein [Planctomycetota bacterium]
MFESSPKKTPIAGRKLPEIDIIKDLAISLLRRSTLGDLLWEIADAIGKMPGFEDSVVYLREGDAMVQRAAYGLKRNEDGTLNKPISIPVGTGIVGHVASTGVPELISDTRQDPRYIFDVYAGLSELTVPVNFEGRVIAVLDTESKKLDAYSQADLEILQTMANISAPRIGSALADQERLRISCELAKLNSELEQRVASRTHELEQANADILQQRDRLESILNSMQDGMISFDQNGTVRLMSPSASRLTGWPIEEAIGLNVASVFVPVSRIDREDFFRLAKLNAPSDTVIQSRDGKLLDVRWTLGESRQVAQAEIVLVFSDVTLRNSWLSRRNRYKES